MKKGKEIILSEFRFYTNPDRTVTITGYDGEVPLELEIPQFIFIREDQYTIRGIANDAFANKGIKYLTFDKRSELDTIGANAFAYNNLEKVVLPDSLTTIKSRAYAYSLTTGEWMSTLTIICV